MRNAKFWVDVAVAIGTTGAVLAALFGKWFQAKVFPPRLSLRLDDPEGEATPEKIGGGPLTQPARYYHLRVHNSRLWSPAHEVRVVLLQVEEPGPTGEPQIVWTGDIPLVWRHQSLYPVGRTIGQDSYADLCSIRESKRLHLHLLIEPLNLKLVREKSTTLIVTLQAQGNEVASPPIRILIAWDGKWEEGKAEMRRHLTVEEIPPSLAN